MKKVFIVILDYNGHENTLELLESLKKVKKENLNLSSVLVDNYPKNPIRIDRSKYESINLSVIYNEKNLGFSGGNNVGIDYSLKEGADYVVILNNDTVVDSEFLLKLVKTAEKDSKAGVVVPKIYFAKGYEFHKKYKEDELGKIIWYAGGLMDWKNVIGHHRGVDEVDVGQYEKTEKTELATGCCVLIKRGVLEKVKGYNEKYFLYYEDADLGERIKKEGYNLVYEPKSILWHKNAQSTGLGSSLQDYFISRNRLLFGFKYAPGRAKIALFRESLKIVLSGREWQKKGVKDFYLGKFGKGSFPL